MSEDNKMFAILAAIVIAAVVVLLVAAMYAPQGGPQAVTEVIQKVLSPRQCLLDDTERYSRLTDVPEGTIAVEFHTDPVRSYFMACRPLEGE